MVHPLGIKVTYDKYRGLARSHCCLTISSSNTGEVQLMQLDTDFINNYFYSALHSSALPGMIETY